MLIFIAILLAGRTCVLLVAGRGMPATFVFGDSLVDAGNNNYLVSLSKANYPPNGIDFDGHQPTGRYTNGRTIVDILGEHINLVSYLNCTIPLPFFWKIRGGNTYASLC
jgi:hypothetical protein